MSKRARLIPGSLAVLTVACASGAAAPSTLPTPLSCARLTAVTDSLTALARERSMLLASPAHVSASSTLDAQRVIAAGKALGDAKATGDSAKVAAATAAYDEAVAGLRAGTTVRLTVIPADFDAINRRFIALATEKRALPTERACAGVPRSAD